ncbi:PilW family protein [Colwellia sp. D2M02]|uniref:PilW family protein n=1 Tax=Colwellia sp. D2M02 TaxID=2841562 RepID=UPI001C089E71|nr:PilW family protein [Colwellia sp. D2M02]MBU2892895.1 PilW family protein [Colwellia sp. D2M02]
MVKVIRNKGSLLQRGFTLVELFVALVIGLVLFAGVMSIFVGMRSTSAETSSYGELQENGRFAISLLTEDLLRQNFWGDFDGVFNTPAIALAPGLAAPGNECNGGGLNNGTFPTGVGPFRTLWGEVVADASPMGCFNDARIGSDVIQIKRVVSTPLAIAPAGNFHLVSNMSEGVLFTSGVVPAINNGRVWQYQHHVYYVRDEAQGASGNTVPVLMQGQLTNQMAFAPVVDGIEMIRFMYGVDTTTDPTLLGYGTIDAYISADNMTEALWNNAGGTRILAVKVYVLARNIMPDAKYTNTNTYQLGNLAVAVNDNYRRLLFSSTVTLFNAGVDSW